MDSSVFSKPILELDSHIQYYSLGSSQALFTLGMDNRQIAMSNSQNQAYSNIKFTICIKS